MNSLLQESIFQDDDEIAIFEVLFDFLKKELDKILIFNQSRKTNADLIKKRKKLLLLLLNLNDDELINDLAENGVGCFHLIYFSYDFLQKHEITYRLGWNDEINLIYENFT